MEQGILIGMHRRHIRSIPRYELVTGYAFRRFEPGDEMRWVAIQAEANADTVQVDLRTFQDTFGNNLDQMPDRSWFVIDPAGREIASITAWWRRVPVDASAGSTAAERNQGLIHWVAVLPDCQGKGIGKAMMTRVMDRLAREYPDVYLNTSTVRLAAIKIYLDFGFLPDMTRERAGEGWAAVRSRLTHPLLNDPAGS